MKNPAPEFTPIMLGPARELFSTDWSIAPDTDKEQPARTAANVLGILTKLIILYVFEVLSPSRIAEIISDKDIFEEPILILMKIPINSKITSKAMITAL